MSRIPQNFIDELLTRIDIIDVIDSSVPLKKKGNNHLACCPFHNEKTPSFTVSQQKQFYYCFGCGASGNAIGFLIDHDRLSFVEAVKTLAHQVGMQMPEHIGTQENDERGPLYEVMSAANDFYQQQLRHHPDSEKVKQYLKQRGLTGKIAKQFQIGYAPSGWGNLRDHLENINDQTLIDTGLLVKNEQGKTYDRFRDRVMFPIRDRKGRVTGFGGRVLGDDLPKYLNSPETPIFHKGTELYGLYEAIQANRQLDQIIVVEGYMDVIALAQYGIHNAVATLGTATTKQNAERLLRQTSSIIFCFDGDKAGRTAAWRALENILSLLEDGINIGFMFLAEGEDPDSMVRSNDKQSFLDATTSATPLSSFLLNHLGEQTDLNTLDGRSRLVKLAEPMLKQIPGKVFQQLLLLELAKRVHMEANQIRAILGLKAMPETKKEYSKKRKLENQPPSLMQQAISLLLQHPELSTKLDKSVSYIDIELPGVDILKSILELLEDDPNLSTGRLLEHWRNTKISQRLARLAMREILIGEQNIVAEFNAIMSRLFILSNENKLSQWQHKASLGELNDIEKKTYMALISKQKIQAEK